MNKNQQAGSVPLVSVGLPTYNRPAGLRKALEHLLLQDYPNLDIVISDNCSTDPLVQEVIREFAAADSRIRPFRQEVNIGLEENFNFTFNMAKADLFMWMSDDDYFDSNYISACVRFLEQHPDYVLCSGVAKYYTGTKFLFTENMFSLNQEKPISRIFSYFSKVGKNGNFYGIFRNRLFSEKPIGLHIGCDWSFMAKLSLLGKLTYTNESSYHRSADGNSGTKKKMIKKFGFNKLQAIFFETYSAYVIASHIFNDNTVNKKYNPLIKKLIVTVVFFQINYLLLANFIKKKTGRPVY